jgi:hypothetical protein
LAENWHGDSSLCPEQCLNDPQAARSTPWPPYGSPKVTQGKSTPLLDLHITSEHSESEFFKYVPDLNIGRVHLQRLKAMRQLWTWTVKLKPILSILTYHFTYLFSLHINFVDCII